MSEVKRKKKILAISDIPIATTGVAVQFNQLIHYLVGTGEYSFYVLGGALKHPTMDIHHINDDYIIEPVVEFGTKDKIREKLIELQPDGVFIFTDPHRYIFLWEMADEIHQLCPILYWHVWDNDPYPDCNNIWYDSTDLINCISRKTYDLVRSKFPEKTHYIPHAFTKELFRPLPADEREKAAQLFYRDKSEWLKFVWVNRNAHRKQPAQVLESFSQFLARLEKEEGHREAVLLMRTEPQDIEGPNILEIINKFDLEENVIIVPEKLDYPHMNMLYNASDVIINVSKAEGFGLSVLAGLQTKTLVIALKTGGMTEQIVDYRDGTPNGIALDPDVRILVGSQPVPAIMEDFVSNDKIVEAMMQVYRMTPEEYQKIVNKAAAYAEDVFNYEKVMSEMKKTMDEAIEDFKTNKYKKNQWQLEEVALSSKKLNGLRKQRDAQLKEQEKQMKEVQEQQKKLTELNMKTSKLVIWDLKSFKVKKVDFQ